MKALIILLALVSFTAAMVPRHRRAINVEEENTMKICAPSTPCAWSIYQPGNKHVESSQILLLTNTYCNCDVGESCQMSEDSATANAFVHRCKRQGAPDS
ncbi:uncharacterized protein LOC123696064 [Colias croceus]|uniref:uncharacterized protein LOC123696064 n=1 Tax=Colias crocea TaxID=72248 RepID=UPI001E2810E6|nr:uncharacterized protein LOC123696064 [Colias croceus]